MRNEVGVTGFRKRGRGDPPTDLDERGKLGLFSSYSRNLPLSPAADIVMAAQGAAD